MVLLTRKSYLIDRNLSEQDANDTARWLTYWLGFRGMPAKVETASMDLGNGRSLSRASIALPPQHSQSTPKGARLPVAYMVEKVVAMARAGLRDYVSGSWVPMNDPTPRHGLTFKHDPATAPVVRPFTMPLKPSPMPNLLRDALARCADEMVAEVKATVGRAIKVMAPRTDPFSGYLSRAMANAGPVPGPAARTPLTPAPPTVTTGERWAQLTATFKDARHATEDAITIIRGQCVQAGYRLDWSRLEIMSHTKGDDGVTLRLRAPLLSGGVTSRKVGL